ncbi:D-3-phosphoglycerate dehydrogenase [Candidatus Magnetoovum chiemensis]|nr:D-3-phosphoglycerate dehydrogenase [Candidatus Magnetoovum chiemensis]
MKVLVSDSLSQRGIDILKEAGLDVDVKVGMQPQELKECLPQYSGIIIRSATRLTEDVLQRADNLKVIGRAGSGLDNVDKAAASKKGIVVMNTPGGNTITTAEHTMALMFALARNIPQATQTMKESKWEKKKFMGIELYNKTLGVVGIGNIGMQVAKRALAFDMNVIGYDPYLKEEHAKKLGIKKVTLDELFKESDIITVHTPLNNETRNLINRDTLSVMKDGVRIINCARGGIVNEKDLYEAIESGKVAGAALDVFEKEPPEDNRLISHNKVICTPHLGAATLEAQENVALAVSEQVADYLINGTIRNAVNFPSIPAEQVETLKPYIGLAEKMGSFISQLIYREVNDIDIKFMGEAADVSTEPIKIAALKGFLTPILEETVNFVNAPFIAKERGIEVKETKSASAGDYNTMLGITVTQNGKEFSVYGTLYSKKDPRIIKVNDFQIEIIPEGTMLYINNNDRPGVIGNIGTIIGDNNINIAKMHFGRQTKGGLAISVVSVDSDLSAELLNKIKSLPNILVVKKITISV